MYDKSKSFQGAAGKTEYELARLPGPSESDPLVLVGTNNVHEFVTSQSKIDGIIEMDAVCYSNMGISLPVKASKLVVEPAAGGGYTIDDIYGDEAGETKAGETKGQVPSAGSASASSASASASDSTSTSASSSASSASASASASTDADILSALGA